MSTSIVWFRKDLRVSDHEALAAAVRESELVYCIATADQVGSTFEGLANVRQNSLRSSWSHLASSLDGKLLVAQNPAELVKIASSVATKKVFVSNVFDTYGVKELAAVEKDLRLAGIELVRRGSNYALQPGTVTKSDGSPYRVYTPFFNEWSKRVFASPAVAPDLSKVDTVPASSKFDPQFELAIDTVAGEDFAKRTLERFLATRITTYDEDRNRADLGGTSHLSHALSHGEIHPNFILAALAEGPGADVFRKEIAWREFYADVLWNQPTTIDDYLDARYAKMRYDHPGEAYEAWKLGRTGFPMVDAGMRQLLSTGWMHNRVRMIVASFLVKDLHVEWQHGAAWFEENLTDFDPASNSHGWQWTAGCGTDASPYYRVFNPISQGLKFDPNGDYVRKFVPELGHLVGVKAHQPWEDAHGYSFGYPKRIVDHATERLEALARLDEIKRS